MTTGARLNAAYLMPGSRKTYEKLVCLVCRKKLNNGKKKRKSQICSNCQSDFGSRDSSAYITKLNYFGRKVNEAYEMGFENGSHFHGGKNNGG